MSEPHESTGCLKGRSVSLWFPIPSTYFHGELTDFDEDHQTYECRYIEGGGVDRSLVVVSWEEDPKNSDGRVLIKDHYLLTVPSGWKPDAPDQTARMTGMGKRPELSKCNKCNHCVNQQTLKQACHKVRAEVLAHAGYHGAMLSAMGPNAVGTRVRIYWPMEKEFFSGYIVDFNFFTWKHQILYDDGDVEERMLYSECVQKPPSGKTECLNWLPEGATLAGFCTRGRFRTRELAAQIVNHKVAVFGEMRKTGMKKWRPAVVTGYVSSNQSHLVEFTDGDSPTSTAIKYDTNVVFLPGPTEGEAQEPLMALADKEAGVSQAQPGRDESKGAVDEPTQSNAQVQPNAAAVHPVNDDGSGTSGSHPEPSSYSEDNPLRCSKASYGQVMLWVSEFLRNDKRVPSDAQKLMAIHEQIQRAQQQLGHHTVSPDNYYGHAFRAMSLPPETWQHSVEQTKAAVEGAGPEMKALLNCQQGAFNTIFPGSVAPPALKTTKGKNKAEVPLEAQPPSKKRPGPRARQ